MKRESFQNKIKWKIKKSIENIKEKRKETIEAKIEK
jgi:hypothetical protein